MGYYDKAKFVGDIHWMNIVHQIMYDVKVQDILFNGKSIGLCKYPHNCTVTFDSGSTYMNVPTYAADLMQHHGIPVHSALPCNKSEQFGKIEFLIDGKKYELENSDWMRDPEPVHAKTNGNQKNAPPAQECKANILVVNVAE